MPGFARDRAGELLARRIWGPALSMASLAGRLRLPSNRCCDRRIQLSVGRRARVCMRAAALYGR
eukprot:6432694-Alexandrium_andersonii.AAC.1